MMYLAEVSLFDAVKRQLRFKLKANIDAYSGLIVLQVIGLVISFEGSGMYGCTATPNGEYIRL